MIGPSCAWLPASGPLRCVGVWECGSVHWQTGRWLPGRRRRQGVDGPLGDVANVNNRRLPTASACPLFEFPPLARLVLFVLLAFAQLWNEEVHCSCTASLSVVFLVHFPVCKGTICTGFLLGVGWFGCWVGCLPGKESKQNIPDPRSQSSQPQPQPQPPFRQSTTKPPTSCTQLSRHRR